MAVAQVATDDQNNYRLTKRGSHNEARDDVAAALKLAAGAVSRLPRRRSRGAYLGTAA